MSFSELTINVILGLDPGIFRTVPLSALPSYFLANPTVHASAPRALRGSATAPLLCNALRAPLQSRVGRQKKSLPATPTVIATLDAAIHTNKSPCCYPALHGSTFLGKKKNVPCTRSAASSGPSKGTSPQKNSFPEPVEGNIQQEDYLLTSGVLRGNP